MARLFSPVNRVLLAFLFIFLILIAAYLWLVPWIGERIAMRFSKSSEISLGNRMYESAITGYKTDETRTALLNDFYSHLNYQTGYPINITVVKSPEMNAFAIPGGHIVVYDAILESMKTPEELAALLAHEASHVALRHSLRTLFRSLSRSMMVSLLFGDRSDVVSALVDNANYLKELEYSRKLETNADDHGLELMQQRRIDPHGMLRLMQMLQQNSRQPEQVSFLSTHPIFKERIAHLQEEVAELPPTHSRSDPALSKIFHELYE